MTAPGTAARERIHLTMIVRSSEDVVCVLSPPVNSRGGHDGNGVHPLLTAIEAV